MPCLAVVLALMMPRLLIAILWIFTGWFRGVFDRVARGTGIQDVSDSWSDVGEIACAHLRGSAFAGSDVGHQQGEFALDEVEIFVAELVEMVSAEHRGAQFKVGKVA